MDLNDRMRHEERVLAVLEDFMGAERVRVSRTLGYPPRLERTIQVDWPQHETELAATLYRALRPVWMEAAEQFRWCEADGMDMGEVDRRVLQEAAAAAQEMARAMTATTQRQVGDAVERLRAGGRRTDYYSELRTIFTGPRISTAAVTGTTQAAVRGMAIAAEHCARARGRGYRIVWKTAKGEGVCPICAPLDGTDRDVWWPHYNDGLMAHPNCRCYLVYMRPRNAKAA